jgi:hypothetical protein
MNEIPSENLRTYFESAKNLRRDKSENIPKDWRNF